MQITLNFEDEQIAKYTISGTFLGENGQHLCIDIKREPINQEV